LWSMTLSDDSAAVPAAEPRPCTFFFYRRAGG
jgi:hypothetical protein